MGSNSYGSNQIDLGMSLKPSYIPKIIAEILKDLEKIDRVEERLNYLESYLKKYKEELSRVEFRKREIPQCMILIVGALEVVKDNIVRTRMNFNGDDLDQKRVDEFLAWKRRIYENEKIKIISSSSFSSSSLHITQPHNEKRKEIKIHRNEMTDNFISRNIKFDDDRISRVKKLNSKNNKFARQKNYSEVAEQVNSDNPARKRKTRRTWTCELHEIFIWAVEQVGGPEVASPKQIREVMGVKGLTNDQIKSHLQKYRLHMRIVPARKGTVKINGPDWLNQLSTTAASPAEDERLSGPSDHFHHDRRYQIPNLNAGIWTPLSAYDHDDVSAFAAWLNNYFRASGNGFGMDSVAGLH